MSTTRTPSILLTWGAVLFSSVLLVAACSGDSTAPGTALAPPSTTALAAGSSSAPLTVISSKSLDPETPIPPTSPSATQEFTPSLEITGPVKLTVSTDAPQSPGVNTQVTLNAPAGAYQRTVGGASDFVQWWLKLGSVSLTAEDTAVFKEFSTSSCSTCLKTLNRIQMFLDAGLSMKSDGEPWTYVFQIDMVDTSTVDAVVHLSAPSLQYLNIDGSVNRDQNAFEYTSGIRLRWLDQHWAVQNFEDLE